MENYQKIVCGLKIEENLEKIRNCYGFCPQNDILYPDLTVEEHLEFVARVKEMPEDRIADEIASVIEKVKAYLVSF